MNKNIDIKITGGGNPQEVAAALRQIAEEVDNGTYIQNVGAYGKWECEDPCLFTEISEEIF